MPDAVDAADAYCLLPLPCYAAFRYGLLLPRLLISLAAMPLIDAAAAMPPLITPFYHATLMPARRAAYAYYSLLCAAMLPLMLLCHLRFDARRLLMRYMSRRHAAMRAAPRGYARMMLMVIAARAADIRAKR